MKKETFAKMILNYYQLKFENSKTHNEFLLWSIKDYFPLFTQTVEIVEQITLLDKKTGE